MRTDFCIYDFILIGGINLIIFFSLFLLGRLQSQMNEMMSTSVYSDNPTWWYITFDAFVKQSTSLVRSGPYLYNVYAVFSENLLRLKIMTLPIDTRVLQVGAKSSLSLKSKRGGIGIE